MDLTVVVFVVGGWRLVVVGGGGGVCTLEGLSRKGREKHGGGNSTK